MMYSLKQTIDYWEQVKKTDPGAYKEMRRRSFTKWKEANPETYREIVKRNNAKAYEKAKQDPVKWEKLLEARRRTQAKRRAEKRIKREGFKVIVKVKGLK